MVPKDEWARLGIEMKWSCRTAVTVLTAVPLETR
jgi:hypothetical protein